MKPALPAITYDVIFTHIDNRTEQYTYFRYEDAFDHFNLFDESDADVFKRIDLVSYNWDDKQTSSICVKFLG